MERVERESESKLKSESWRVASDRIGFGTSIAERVPTCALHRGAVRRTAADGTNEATRDDTIRDETRRNETRRDDTRRSGITCGEGDKAKRGEARPVEPSRVKSSRVESERESVAGDSSGRQVRYVGFVILSRSLQTTCAAP